MKECPVSFFVLCISITRVPFRFVIEVGGGMKRTKQTVSRSYCAQIIVHINNSRFFTDCHHRCHHMPTNDLKTRRRHTKSRKWLDRRTSHRFDRCLRQEVTAKIFTNSGSEGRSRIVWLVRDLAMDFERLRMSVSIRDVYMEQTRGPRLWTSWLFCSKLSAHCRRNISYITDYFLYEGPNGIHS